MSDMTYEEMSGLLGRKADTLCVRVARALPVEVEVSGIMRANVTMDIAVGGFSVILTKPPALGTVVPFNLKIPGAQDRLEGDAKLISSQQRPGGARCSFEFLRFTKEQEDAIEQLVIDSLLEQIKV